MIGQSLRKIRSSNCIIIDINVVFIQPAKVTNMYKENKESDNKKTKVDRRHGSHVWFHKNCEMLQRECMSIKNSLSISGTPDETHLLYLEHIREFTTNCIKNQEDIHKGIPQ